MHAPTARVLTENPAKLYVVTAVTNQCRFRSRYDLYQKFEKYIADSGAILLTVEAAFGARPHAVTDSKHIQLRTSHEVWHKENMLNIAISRLPADWEYVAWIDADIIFARPDWVVETLHLLQHYHVIQMFSQAQDLSPNHEPLNTHKSFMSQYINLSDPFDPDFDKEEAVHRSLYPQEYTENDGYSVIKQHLRAESWHPGFAWAARREAIDHLGGLIDWAVLGAADRHMAYALVGKVEASFEKGVHENYTRPILEWQNRAEKHIKRNVGCMNGLLLHYWHGKKDNRCYHQRWNIIKKHGFNPETDLKRDSQGLWQLTDRSIGLRDDLRTYFCMRNEDDVSVD